MEIRTRRVHQIHPSQAEGLTPKRWPPTRLSIPAPLSSEGDNYLYTSIHLHRLSPSRIINLASGGRGARPAGNIYKARGMDGRETGGGSAVQGLEGLPRAIQA